MIANMEITRAYHKWHSPALQREMELLTFGHSGARVVAFPTSQGRFFDWEDRGLIRALGEHLSKGWIQLLCVDSVDRESWYARHLHPSDRAKRQSLYDAYILNEVLPFSTKQNPNPFLITTGASFGAYHAANFAFRHPEVVGRMIGMSGYYDVKRWTGGFSDDNVYFNNPPDFILHEHDEARLRDMRKMDIILAIGRTDSALANNEYLSRVLWSKDIGNALRIWDGFAHDWDVWERMLQLYIGGHD